MTVYLLNPSDQDVAYGGVQKLYEFSEDLCDSGIDAVVVEPEAFRGSWFSTRAQRRKPPLSVSRSDLLLVPEVYGDGLLHLAPGVPRVSLNQNPFLTHQNVGDPRRHPCEVSSDVVGILTVSDYSVQFLQMLFPTLSVDRVVLGVDPAKFFCPAADRRPRVAYMRRKREEQVRAVIGHLQHDQRTSGWEFVLLDALSHQGVAEQLRTCQLFVSFSHREGFGLPVAEALASGCDVVGFSGLGGRELFSSFGCQEIPDDDVVGLAQASRAWLERNTWDLEERRSVSTAVLGRYSRASQRQSLTAAVARHLTTCEVQAVSDRHLLRRRTITPRDLVVPQRSLLRRAARSVLRTVRPRRG